MPIVYLTLALVLSFVPNVYAQGYIEALKVENLTLPTQTASKVLVLDSNKKAITSSVTSTELLGLVGIGSTAIQTQLDSKQASGNYITALTGDITATGPGSVSATLAPITNSKIAAAAGIGVTKIEALTASRPVVTNASGFLSTPSATLSTQLGGTGLDNSAASGLLKFNIGTPSVSSGQVVNADVSAAAGIGVTKLEALTASRPVITDGSGFFTTEAALAISRGGTNNGSLAVTAGGVLYTDGSKIANVGIGTTGFVLTSQGSSAPSWTAVSVTNTVVTKSSDATLSSSDNTVLCDTSGGDVTLTFPAAASNSGIQWVIKKTSASNLCILDGNSSETIDGDTTVSLVTNKASAVVYSDGTNLRFHSINDPWRVDVNISGANVSLGTVANASYSEMSSGSLTLTQNSGAITSQITCNGTNAPSGTTCSSGNESPGVVFTLPRSGVTLRACMSFTHQILNGVGGATNTYFQLVETASNAQTILQEGKDRIGSGYNVASNQHYSPLQVCGTFPMTSTGLKAIRLFFEQEVGGTVTASQILADGAASSGQRDIHLTIWPLQ